MSGLSVDGSRKSLNLQRFEHESCSARALQLSLKSELVVIRKAQGFALIDLVFVCGIIGLLSSIALPRMLLAQQAAGASSAIGSLRTIGSAELTFALTCGSGFYAPNLTALGTPPPGSNDAFIAPTLSAGNTVVRSGYLF